VISVVVLQNSMALLKDEHGFSTEACVTSTFDCNEVTCIKIETSTDTKEEEDRQPKTIPVIKTEPKVSGVPVVSVMHTSYSPYPELTAHISVCPCETKI
jgi:hypothetical protein